MGMGIMWRICTVSEKKCSSYVKPLGEMIAERFGVHGFPVSCSKAGVMLTFFSILVDLDRSRIYMLFKRSLHGNQRWSGICG